MVTAARRPPRRWTLAVLLAVLVLLVAAGSLARFYTDLLWYREVGKTGVFWGQLRAKLTLGFVAGLGTALVVGLNLWMVERLAPRYGLAALSRPAVERYRTILTPYLRPLRLGVAAFLGLVIGLQATGAWQSYLLWRNATRFGSTDAQFHRDIGYYVFSLPFQRALFGWAFTTVLLATLLTAAGHYVLGGIRPQTPGNRIAPPVQAHLLILLGVLVALKAYAYRLDQYSLVFSERGVVTGASYTDVHAQLPALRLLFWVSILVAVLFFVAAWRRGAFLPLAGVALLGIASILVGGLIPTFVQRFRVAPEELARERPYIQRNIAATQKAFGLDKIEVKAFDAGGTVTPNDANANKTTLDNVRVWRPEELKQAIQNLQAIGQYYDFSDVDVDRYPIDGTERQVMISAREVDPSQLAASSKTWQNLHLGYTHGYGVVAAQVNTAGPGGQPDFVVKGFDAPDAKIKAAQPRIYFGEPPSTGPAFVVVDTKQPEVDKPQVGDSAGDGTATAGQALTTSYGGRGGIELSNPLARLAFALRFRDVNLFISSNITPRSRLMFNRDIRDRVEKVAPFLQWDGDPYVAVVDGRIVYIRDGYTTTDNYPYSERVDLAKAARRTDPADRAVRGTANYIRNSVKAVVDAYDGSVRLYVFDTNDPVLRAWQKAFPGLFTSGDQIGGSLRQHFRFPEDLFSVQTQQYTTYHMSNADAFYSKQDLWVLPSDTSGALQQGESGATGLVSGDVRLRMRPYYLLAKLPGASSEEFILTMPFTPNNKNNMVAYMAVRSDPSSYGNVTLFSLPRSSQIPGPTQANARLLQNPDISKDLTLLNQSGSKVTLGNLLSIPIADSFLYVQPIFVQATQSPIPQLYKVGVVLNNTIGYQPSLADAIAEVLGQAPPPSTSATGGTQQPPSTGSSQVANLLSQAQQEYNKAQDALKKGDLATYQQHINKVGQLIQQAAAAAKSPTPAPVPPKG